jgi:2-desacetyl-2-hydroxyethyl bacteriochlorophyllide A dehydrogenase
VSTPARQAQAVIFTGDGTVTVGQVELPPLDDQDVLIQTRVSVVSAGTEGWVLHDRMGWAGPSPYPLVPGYQKAGVVREVGAAVRGLAPGDRVAMTTGRLAGAVRAHWGGHVSLGQQVQEEALKLQDEVSDEDAANLVVAQVGYNAASRPRLEGGEVAAVFGDGLIGQLAAQALRARGARVVLCGRRAARLELGTAYSADAAVNVATSDARAALRELAPGGLDVVVDTSNAPDMALFMDVLRPRDGQIVLSGSYYTAYASGRGLTVDADALQKREIALLTNSGWTRPRLEATLALMARGLLRTTPLITHRVSYREAPRAWQMIEARDQAVLGVAFTWDTLDDARS